MTREIKFRAWSKDTLKMTESKELWRWLTTEHNNGIAAGSMGVEQTPIDKNEYEHLELMQFTGLLDKNGKEIYEGDVVKCTKGCHHEVVWMDEVPNENMGGMPGFYLKGLFAGYSWMKLEEVIGNIYENPELLT